MNVRMNRVIMEFDIFQKATICKSSMAKTTGPWGNQHLELHQEVELEGVQLEIV
jgi:hypothetical protein